MSKTSTVALALCMLMMCSGGLIAARKAAQAGDDETNDLLVSRVIRTNELEVWLLTEHLANIPMAKAD